MRYRRSNRLKGDLGELSSVIGSVRPPLWKIARPHYTRSAGQARMSGAGQQLAPPRIDYILEAARYRKAACGRYANI
jgi:hypothetical protein